MCACVCQPASRAPVYCMMRSGRMLKSRSSLSRRTSSRSGASSCSAPCRSAVPLRGRPFSLTMTSPSLMPPLGGAQGVRGQLEWVKRAERRRRGGPVCRRQGHNSMHVNPAADVGNVWILLL